MIETEKYNSQVQNEAFARERYWFEQNYASSNSYKTNRTRGNIQLIILIIQTSNKEIYVLGEKENILNDRKEAFITKVKEYPIMNKEAIAEEFYLQNVIVDLVLVLEN